MGNTMASGDGGEEDELLEGMPATTAANAAQPSNTPEPVSTPAATLPPPGLLLDQAQLREAAARLRQEASQESLVAQHHDALLRRLQERQGRGEDTITLDQFCEMLENRTGGRVEWEQAFAQFDAEGDGIVYVENMLETLKNSRGANLQGELNHVIRQLQACSLTPGFIDIFSKSKDRLVFHSAKILRFLHRNRISSNVIPYPLLECCNNICTMRSSVLKDYLDRLLQIEKESPPDQNGEQDVDTKPVAKCYRCIETSSNSGDIEKMTNGETTSFWQSDGSARSHWVRLKMKPDVVLRHLSIAVASVDQSYMPQQVAVAVGRNLSNLQEVRDVHIPSNVTGYVTLLENANINQLYVQINIKRCLSDGCDCRIHGLRAVGYQKVKKSGVSVSDASAIWYLSLLTSLVTASLETNPPIAQAVLENTQKALQHMPPLSLTPGSTEFPGFLSPNILEEVDGFLARIAACCFSTEVDLTLLGFALARGSVAKVITSFCTIVDHLETQYKASSLITSMAAVQRKLLYKYGKPIQLTLLACDVKGKEDKSGPENMLVEPFTGDGFLTETGKTRGSIILCTEKECSFQVTQMGFKVRKGAIGAKCGLVFAFNSSQDKFHAEEFFKRFEKYDTWHFKEFKQFVKSRTGLQSTDEDEPVGWFELEDEWDEVEIKMQHCRTAKYLMVKFLCTRETTAERLGVQGLTAFGYLQPVVGRKNPVMQCLKCTQTEEDSICGMTLLLKTLQFIQQIALDMGDKDSTHSTKSFLDFTGLDLQLFWKLYSVLKDNPREECIYAQTVLLRLLQSCFSVLTVGSQAQKSWETTQSKQTNHIESAKQLYRHLCEVVDGVDVASSPLDMLKQEVIQMLQNGAALFFSDRDIRRDQLFTLMKRITEEDQPQSVHLTYQSLCTYFSDQDPGELLLLPDKSASEDFSISKVLSVMETLLLVATNECKMMMADVAPKESGSVIFSLFWAAQGSLLSWCYLHLKVSDSSNQHLAREILVKYVEQFLSSVQSTLASLLSEHGGKKIIEKLSESVFAMATRQLMTFMLDFCTLDIPHCDMFNQFRTLIKPLKELCEDSEELNNKVDSEKWQQPVVLRTWTMESPHNYENNCHDVTIFFCPGATYFELEFDEKCETEKRCDYLEFTDARGVKVCYDTKVDTEKWPKKVTIRAGPRLQFLFHSDSSNNEWGYKFTVVAYGLPDVALSWGLDLQLLVARLLGRLASRAVGLKSSCELGDAADLPPAKVASIISSPLWKPIFRHQVSTTPNLNALIPGDDQSKETMKFHADDCRNFLLDFANSDPTKDFCGPNSEIFKKLLQTCRKQLAKSDIVGGSVVDQAVNATFAALVYLTPDLFGKLKKYVAMEEGASLSDEFEKVYSLADGIRIWMLEMKQKSLTTKGNSTEDKLTNEKNEVNPEILAKNCIEKSLLLLNFVPIGAPTRVVTSLSLEAHSTATTLERFRNPLQRQSSIIEGDFQAVTSQNETVHPTATGNHQALDLGTEKKEKSASFQKEMSSASESIHLDNPVSQTEEPSSPLSSSTPKTQFSRGRLRLLSFRSMEEPKSVPTVKEKYPILKNILDFIKDQSISHESVLQVLFLRKAQAQCILKILDMVRQCLQTLGEPHFFQPSGILFLLELLTCQKDFTNCFGHLEGCGAELQKDIRQSYYQLVLLLVNAVKGFSDITDRSLLPALSCVQTSLLHLLDTIWEPKDLAFFVDINLPDLLFTMSQENISTHDSASCQWNEEEEIADYKQNCEWMDECKDGMFETWYEKIAPAGPEKRRKMHMFIARYCDLLNVEISCDGCDKIAPWHRYRCLQCNDMDLCKTCFLGGVKPEGHEDDHEMVNMEYACDHCQGLIIGHRINCNVCDDFDLCYGCFFAKKYSDSHLPTHSTTDYPMVTIRISEQQRLIQPYIHNYSWLLFTALALYSSDLTSEEEVDGEKIDSKVLDHARTLQIRCTELITSCLIKGQQGKGMKVSSMLSIWKNNESFSENEIPFVSSTTDSTAEVAQDSLGSSVVHVSNSLPKGPPMHSDNDKVGADKDSVSTESSQQAEAAKETPFESVPEKHKNDVSNEVLPKVEDTIFEQVDDSSEVISSKLLDAKNMDAFSQKAEKTSSLSQEQVFAECSQERILGLLAAMLPSVKSNSSFSLRSLEQIVSLMFQVVISNAGHLNETYNLTLGLLGQLILRASPVEVDAAITKVLSVRHNFPATADGSAAPEGWKTTQLLFNLGAICLDSRVGLDWACSIADILRELNSSQKWHGVIAAFTDHCVKQLPFQLKHTNIFALLVLVGFPEVLCMGTRSVYLDNANEPHNVIILKHFTEKNRAVIIDIKTRKRKTVKDYQLKHHCDEDSPDLQAQFRHHLLHMAFITSHLLQTNMESSYSESVEATWVLSLALKGLYKTVKSLGFEGIQSAFLQSGLLKLLVKKCSKGTGFSKTWLLRDLEILSIMLYSSKKEINTFAERAESELEESDQDQDQSTASNIDLDQNKPDPLEGLDEATKVCFLMTHDALNAPLHILRAMYEVQMKRTDWFFLDVQKRFDGDVISTDERIRALAEKWQPSKQLRSEEQTSKAVDTDMIILPSLSKSVHCEKATEETNVVTQKLITNTESDLQISYAKQRRTKSSVLLHKELDSRSKKAVRDYLYRVNEATAVLYARHVLASLLAEWPDGLAVNEEILELSGPAHMTYILDMLMQLEEKQLWEKILQKVLQGCSVSMLGTVALTACQFMEEPGMAVQARESTHPYNNNTNFEDKVHIPGAIYLSVKFDPQCHTEDGCDELQISSTNDFQQDRHVFSGSPQKWTDFELPGDTLYYRFTSDISNTEWGYKFTVTAGHRGRFQTGFEILKQMLSDQRVVPHLPLGQIWDWQVCVACRQTGHQRLKAIHLLLRILQCSPQRDCDLTLLKPLWQLFIHMEKNLCIDTTIANVLLPLHRALTELFFFTENRANELGCLQDYLLALTTEDHIRNYTLQALKNVAAISLAINHPNRSTSSCTV